MSMTLLEVSEQGKIFFESFNILNAGLVLLWVIGNFVLGFSISKNKKEGVLATISFLMFGGLIFFAEDPMKYIILVVVVFVVILGFFRILWRRPNG